MSGGKTSISSPGPPKSSPPLEIKMISATPSLFSTATASTFGPKNLENLPINPSHSSLVILGDSNVKTIAYLPFTICSATPINFGLCLFCNPPGRLNLKTIFIASSKCCSSPYRYLVTSFLNCVNTAVDCSSLTFTASSYDSHSSGNNSAYFNAKPINEIGKP